MKNYRITETGRIIPHNEMRAEFPNVSFADTIDSDILEALGLEAAADSPDAPPQPPQSVTRRQARQALLLAGLLDAVQPAIDAIPDNPDTTPHDMARRMAQIEWDDALDFERSNPLLLTLATALGLDGAALDALFLTAAGL